MSNDGRLRVERGSKKSSERNRRERGGPKRSDVSRVKSGEGRGRRSGNRSDDFEQLRRCLEKMNPEDRAQLLDFFLKMSRYVASLREASAGPIEFRRI